MSAFDVLSWLRSFAGQADPRTGTLTGDLSQRDKGQIARILQSTSPGLAGNAAGSVGEQIQRLVDLYALSVASGLPASSLAGSPLQRLLYLADQMNLVAGQLYGTTANAQVASTTGSLAQQIAAMAATFAPTSDAYLPNGVTAFGFRGDLVNSAATSATDPRLQEINNLRATGWTETLTSGSINYRQANPTAGRPATLMLRTGAVLNDVIAINGVVSTGGAIRNVYQAATTFPFFGDAARWTLDCTVLLPSIANVSVFVGASDNGGATPSAAGSRAVMAYYSSGYIANWALLTNNAGAQTGVDTGTALVANTPFRVKMELANALFRVKINNGAWFSATVNIPTVGMQPIMMIQTLAASAKDLHVEWSADRIAA